MKGEAQDWSSFAELEGLTTVPAAELVRFSGVGPGDRVLDVACGTGVVAVTAARAGARVTGLDLTPALLGLARRNAAIAGVDATFVEGDAEALPFPDGAFDGVLSQFGHLFAPRPLVALGELLRVTRPGGTVAFSTWTPEGFVGRLFALVERYVPPAEGAALPAQWGDRSIVTERFAGRGGELRFQPGVVFAPALSPAHDRVSTEHAAGPVRKLVEQLGEGPRLEAFRREYDALTTEFFRANAVRHDFLMTRGTKAAR